jgi:hypothetical protein
MENPIKSEGLAPCAALTLSIERGQKYVGSQWHSWPEEHGEPAISWSTNDEELLVPSRPFPHPIALPKLFPQESQNNGGNPCSQVRERREPDNTTPVHLEEPSKNLAKYIVPPYSPTYAGIPSLFSPVHPFSPQCSSPYNNSRFNWQVGNLQSVLSAHQSFLQEFVSSIEQGAILPTNPQAPILSGNGGLYHEKAGDRDHASDGVISNLPLGDDESSDSVEFSKEDLHHPTHWRGNTGKQRHSGREKRRRHKAGRNGDIKRESQKQYLRNKNTKDVIYSDLNSFKAS